MLRYLVTMCFTGPPLSQEWMLARHIHCSCPPLEWVWSCDTTGRWVMRGNLLGRFWESSSTLVKIDKKNNWPFLLLDKLCKKVEAAEAIGSSLVGGEGWVEGPDKLRMAEQSRKWKETPAPPCWAVLKPPCPWIVLLCGMRNPLLFSAPIVGFSATCDRKAF